MRASLFRPATRLMALVATGLTLTLFSAPAAQAQSPFAAALYVNDAAITNYDVTQKMRFLEFIGASGGNARERAIERLIEDRLQLQEVSRLGGRLTPDQIRAGMTEFAARADLTADEMLARMQQAGIDRETFESFIRSGVMWRELVRTLYGPQITITEAQIDQAISVEGVQPSTEVLISEIFLPSDPQFAEQVQRIIPQIQAIRSENEFANAARQVSASPSGPSGGRVDRWIN
ncbi:MAG: peptidylprolyl isomerase, partial [Pararhodobacter sp.]